ncbi:MAG TPA: S8 family serine peptidase [Planctomycetota bacterium]|nr:S8 family serine peptidase [Planctomycetota bacterium]
MLSPVQAQAGQGASPGHRVHPQEQRFETRGAKVRRWVDGGVTRTARSRDGGVTWQPLLDADDRVHHVLAKFDPAMAPLQLPGPMAAPAGTRLYLVQFQTQVLDEYHEAVALAGAQILFYLPANLLGVRCDARVAKGIEDLSCVRWVGPLQNGFKLDAELRGFAGGGGSARECNLVLAAKADRLLLAGQIDAIGGQVTDLCEGSIMIRASLTPKQLLDVMSLDTVVWADPATPIGYDMDNARIQGGADAIEAAANYLGQGVRAEITEFFQETHPDFVGRFLVRSQGSASHGHCTAGIVGGAGAGMFSARGMMPLCTIIEGGYSSASSHYNQIQGSVNPALAWKTMVATSSWGSTQTPQYTAVSSAMDDALFDSDLTRCQSQSNLGDQRSRPEAWAKNIISGGGLSHGNNPNPLDDVWTTASIGPASDGRLKPDACAYYDNVLTSDLAGTSGYSSTNYTATFSGTSSATPIIAGHVGLIQQMFTDGLFGNPLPMPATDANRFANKPHMTTSKALLCNTASQYAFSGATHNLTRTHQGWGFPSVSRLYENRKKILVVDEYDTLQLGQARTYLVWVAPGTAEFRATMVYADPAAAALAAIQLINNANLKVTRLSDGTFWWGNNGLAVGTTSTPGGVPNDRDNIECVYLDNPQAGIYLVTVEATSIVQDGKIETPQLDLDYALVVHPLGGGYQNDTGMTLDLSSTGPGNLTISAANVPATGWVEGFTALSFSTLGGRGFGRFFGIEDDFLTVLLWTMPLAPGNAFHFSDGGPGVFPFAPFVFPDPGIISFLAGIPIDGVMMLFDANGNIVAQSNVDRLTLQ